MPKVRNEAECATSWTVLTFGRLTVPVVPFYRKMGYECEGEEFQWVFGHRKRFLQLNAPPCAPREDGTPHIFMRKRLAKSATSTVA